MSRFKGHIIGFLIFSLIVLCNLAVWFMMNQPKDGLPWRGTIRSLSFSPYQRDHNPLEGKLATLEEIDHDLSLLQGVTTSVRTYTMLDNLDVVPALAAKYGINVTLGAWIDGRLMKNEIELDKLIEETRRNRNVERVIVGNEAILRSDAALKGEDTEAKPEVTIAQMIRYLRRVRAAVDVPVSTAEPWHVWLSYPELVNEVDFIAVHLLPYWEQVPEGESVSYILMRYEELQKAFPGKPILIAEVGWPSAGRSRGTAVPSLINQALFLRQFLNVASLRDIDYNIIEAFDQPWKKGIEHSVGAHWGVFTADRESKFSWVNPVVEFKMWPLQAIAATILAFLPVLIFLYRWNDLRLPGRIFFAVLVQAAASLVIWTMSVPVIRDTAPGHGLLYAVLVPSQLLLLVVVLIAGFELTQLTWASRMRRRFTPHDPEAPLTYAPKVSLHLAIYNEPAEMVKETLDSLNALNYPDFEVLVIDNNTKDPAVWQPVKEYCEKLGPRFRFFSLGKWPGFKAGALNFGLTQTAKDAQVIGVIDSDYIVDPNWLRSMVPFFQDPKVGWVQAPQDHREWQDDLFKQMINWEYAGFFDIGMVARNESNAIIQHGTMTLIRKAAMDEVGNWGEWCICEDAELGLRLLKAGYDSIYSNHRFGHGLTPDSFTAYKKQRFRWAYGAVQILKGHWRSLTPFRKTGLTTGQKYHFVAGWLPWFADALYLLFTILSLFWSAGLLLAPRYFDFPLSIFILPTIGVFIAKIIHHLFLYSTRVRCSFWEMLGSAVAGMGLTYSIALAMWQGIFTKHTPFIRTPKMANKGAFTKSFLMASEEAILMLLLWAAAAGVYVAYHFDADFNYRPYPDATLWAIVLVVQSMPFAAALLTSIISVLPSRSERRNKKNKKKTPQTA